MRHASLFGLCAGRMDKQRLSGNHLKFFSFHALMVVYVLACKHTPGQALLAIILPLLAYCGSANCEQTLNLSCDLT